MKIELEDKLFDKFPKLFANRTSKYSCMCRGFECEDGWYDILYTLCYTIQDYCDALGKRDQVIVEQVKEKFGTLSFYVSYSDRFVDGVILFASRMSAITCETCGDRGGRKNENGWITTLCPKCSTDGSTDGSTEGK